MREIVASEASLVTEGTRPPQPRITYVLHVPAMIAAWPSHADMGLPPWLRPGRIARRQSVTYWLAGAALTVGVWVGLGDAIVAGITMGVMAAVGLAVRLGVGRASWSRQLATQIWRQSASRFPDRAVVTVEVAQGELRVQTPTYTATMPASSVASVTRSDKALFVWVRDQWAFVPVGATDVRSGDVDGFAAAVLAARDQPLEVAELDPADGVQLPVELPRPVGFAARTLYWATRFGDNRTLRWLPAILAIMVVGGLVVNPVLLGAALAIGMLYGVMFVAHVRAAHRTEVPRTGVAQLDRAGQIRVRIADRTSERSIRDLTRLQRWGPREAWLGFGAEVWFLRTSDAGSLDRFVDAVREQGAGSAGAEDGDARLLE